MLKNRTIIQSTLWVLFICTLATFSGCNKDSLAILTTIEITEITSESASSGGSISDNGGSVISERGICWSALPSPNINNATTTVGKGIGSFAAEVSNLEPSTTYYVRAYAKNDEGVSYGNELTFTTQEQPNSTPEVSTVEVKEITSTQATSGGSIINDGGSSISTKGICWSLSPNPTIDNEKNEVGSGSDDFIATLNNLAKDTKYYVRAFATNENGTGYGNEVSFTTSALTAIKASGTTYYVHPSATFLSTWGPSFFTGAISQADGEENTLLLAKLSEENAGKKCADLTVEGYNDWFLPAGRELEILFKANEDAFPKESEDFWTSSEHTTLEKTAFLFGKDDPFTGGPFIIEIPKDRALTCLCVRKD